MLKVHVLLRVAKKSGKIDMEMTAQGKALLELWAMNNTTRTKYCVIIERDTGEVVFASYGTVSGMPKVKKGNLGSCEEMLGIPVDTIKEIKDDRFDKEEN